MPEGRARMMSSSRRSSRKDESRENVGVARDPAFMNETVPLKAERGQSNRLQEGAFRRPAGRVPHSPFASEPAQDQLSRRQENSIETALAGLRTDPLRCPFMADVTKGHGPGSEQTGRADSGIGKAHLQVSGIGRLNERSASGKAGTSISPRLSSSPKHSLPITNSKDKASRYPSPGREKDIADRSTSQLRARRKQEGPLPQHRPGNSQSVTGTQNVASSAASGSSHPDDGPIVLGEYTSINVGIETELLIQSKSFTSCSMTEMVERLAQRHNSEIPQGFPKMKEDLRPNTKDAKYEEWLWTIDSTIQTCDAPWGLELVSPILTVVPNSSWRSHVTKTWEFLERGYQITSDISCGTHIHVSRKRPSYGVRDIRRIASAAMWFEPALEAIVPESRRENDFCRGNYINSPGARFGRTSRVELIKQLESEKTIQALMCLVQQEDRHFSWNFWSIYKHRSIEFRKPPPSTTLAEVLSWVEYAMTFVEAARRNGTPEQLATYPQNVGGLRRFLRETHIQGISQPERMDRLWRGHADDEAIEPQILSQPRDYIGDQPGSSSSSIGTAGSSRADSYSAVGYRA